VRVRFGDRQLQRRYESHRLAERAWGAIVARRYVMRIDAIRAASNTGDLYANPSLRFHGLTGDRHGQFAVSITGQKRLILTFEDDNATAVIVEVVDYHG